MNHSPDTLPHAFGAPPVTGTLRTTPEDFFVEEILPFEPEGEGEHVLLHIEKRNTNTDWLAGQLARFAGVPKRDVGYAGLKDRHAVTRQWFSVGLAGRPGPDWSGLALEGVTVLQHARHRRKLRRGALLGNRFRIRIRDLRGDRDGLAARLAQIAKRGVPNYFGEQRFGREGSNLEQARAMFGGRRIRDRHRRSLYLSAARSFLFNELLARRVIAGNWDRPVAGDVMLLDGSHSYFVVDGVDEDIRRRCREFDVHPGGVLWGQGEMAGRQEAAKYEQALADAHPEFCQGLEQAGLERAYRPLRLAVRDLEGQVDAGAGRIELAFRLPAGAYATTVIRELAATAV